MRQFAPIVIVLLGLMLRMGWIATHFDELAVDTDAYWRLAENVAQGAGLVVDPQAPATAYRPPLFPILLGGIVRVFNDPLLGMGILNAVSGAVTILLTIALGCHLGLGQWGRLIPGLLVAVDPLMLRYCSQTMTETFFTMLLLFWYFSLIRWKEAEFSQKAKESFRFAILTGFLFGLTVLTRPTLWPVVGFLGLACLGRVHWQNSRPVLLCCFSTLLVVMPWVIRNQLALGSPILMTTHGGYTLLLGNNPSFHKAVIGQPWGTAWRGEPDVEESINQSVWLSQLQAEMKAQGIEGEIAQDRWMSKRARDNIFSDPVLFLRSAGRRMMRLWALAPMGPAATGVSPILWWGVALFSGILITAAAVGTLRLLLLEKHQLLGSVWFPVLAIVLTFCCVHLFYWTNTRMRLPIEPFLAMLAMRAITSEASCQAGRTRHSTAQPLPE